MRVFIDQIMSGILIVIFIIFGMTIYKNVSRSLYVGGWIVGNEQKEQQAILPAIKKGVFSCVLFLKSLIVGEKHTDPGIRKYKRYIRRSGKKDDINNDRTFFKKGWKSFYKGVASVMKDFKFFVSERFVELIEVQTIKKILIDIGIIAIISIALAILAGKEKGGLDLYLTTYLPMLGVFGIMIIYNEMVKGNREFLFWIILLMLLGNSLQIMLAHSAENAVATVRGTAKLTWIGLVCALVIIPIVIGIMKNIDKAKVILYGVSVLVLAYLCLVIFGTVHNSAKLWIYVGSNSIQVTELTKLLTIFLFGLIFTYKKWSSNIRLLTAACVLGINVFFLLICNELGTLLVLGIIFTILAFLYLPSIKELLIVLSIGAACSFAIFYGCKVCYNKVHNIQEQQMVSETVADDTQSEASREIEVSKFPQWMVLGSKIYNKVYSRFKVLIDPESVNIADEGYQMDKARTAILLAKWFGSSYDVTIPVADSDYIFTYLLLKMGILPGIMILLMLLRILLMVGVDSLLVKDTTMGAVSEGFVLSIVMGSLIAAASASNILPTVGIPFAFLASGGSSMMVNLIMVLFILWANGANGGKIKKNRRLQRYYETTENE